MLGSWVCETVHYVLQVTPDDVLLPAVPAKPFISN